MNKKDQNDLQFSLTTFTPPAPGATGTAGAGSVFPDGRSLMNFLARTSESQKIAKALRENRIRMLQEVTVKAKKVPPRDSRKLYSAADATLKVTPQMAGSATSLLDLLVGRIAGVMVSGAGMNATVSIRGQGEPLFVLDGIPADKTVITSLSLHDVESIDVLKGPSAAIFRISRGERRNFHTH